MTRGTGRLGRPEEPGERWDELVELYEYRVRDALQGQVPRGGLRSLADLREELLAASLEPALYRRLLDADRQYRSRRKALSEPQATLPSPASPPAVWDAPPGGEAEAQAWQDLHLLAWGDAARATLKGLMTGWQREPSLLALRVLYTALENAERSVQAGLSGQMPFAVPTLNDPLTDLDHPQVLQVLTDAAIDLLVQPGGPAQLQTALSQVQEVPFPRHPDEDVLEARVAAVEREPMAPRAKEMLIQALRTHHATPQRDPRERPAIREAARELVHALEPLLSSHPHGHLSNPPQHSVLHAAQPVTALRAPDDGADELVIHLAGTQARATRWRGTDFQWQAIGPHWQLLAGDQVALLQPGASAAERHVTLNLTHIRFDAFVSGAYLLLRVQTSPQEELGRLLSLGRAVALLLDPAEAYAALRLGRAAAQRLREGWVDAPALAPGSAAKYALASPTALLGFARKGAEALCAHLSRCNTQEIHASVRDSARSLALSGPWDDRLAEALNIAVHRLDACPPPVGHGRLELPQDGSVVCAHLRENPPLTLQLGPRVITLRRDFRREWAAIMPGHPPTVLEDLTVTRVPGFSVILARHGNWLAAAAQPAPQPQDTH